MSLPVEDSQTSLLHVGFLADGLFGKTDRYRLFREKILPALRGAREKFAELYCVTSGRPAIEPVIMAGTTLLQFMEKAPDRKAVNELRLNIGWKYALDLTLDYAGFDPSSLVYFRRRLVNSGSERLLFDTILHELQKAGLVRKKRKERIDSTHIVGNVARLSRLEMVRETLRLFMKEITKQNGIDVPENWEELEERYVDTDIDYHRLTKVTISKKTKQAGNDMQRIVSWLSNQPQWVRDLEESTLLERVYHEQYEEREGKGPTFRKKEGSGTVKNPHDPEVQWATKDKDLRKQWEGYKLQVIETVGEKTTEPGEPTGGVITEMTTTPALVSDVEGMEEALAAQREHGVGVAEELHADAGYVTDDTLAEAKEEGRELIGPARPAPTKGVLPVEQFEVDMKKKEAVCPQGKTSTRYRVTTESRTGRESHQFEWGEHCDGCPLQSQCTKSKTGRRRLTVGRHHEELQARRREMEDEAYRALLRKRNGIEGTISEGVRAYGMRRTRYRGLAKTRLANYTIGAACNVNRWLRRIAWEMEVIPQGV
jgi:transposase/IS5 family transposase